jgi:hypothetical protein
MDEGETGVRLQSCGPEPTGSSARRVRRPARDPDARDADGVLLDYPAAVRRARDDASRITDSGGELMADTAAARQRRQWADVMAIVTGVTAVGLAIWPNLAADEGGGVGIGTAAIATALGGALAIAAVLLAQRSPGTAKIPLALGGILLILTPFLFVRADGLVPTLQIIVGILMLTSAPFIGRMPDDVPPRGPRAG